ncbi:MAG TPA: hypothetical protein VIT92_06510 [Burkholderiaceae bacterium]
MKKIALSVIPFLLVSCGGGGGGGSSTPVPVVPTPVEPSEINVAEAFKNFINTPATTSSIPSIGGAGTATLIVRSEETYPFVTNGVSQPATSSKAVQLQRIGSDGKLTIQQVWKINFDAQMKPIGMAIGDQFARYNECMTVKSKFDLPTLSGTSGTYFSGAKSVNYAETFRAGTYAHYCDFSVDSTHNVEWSVLKSGTTLYACTTFPALLTAPRTRICRQSSTAGTLGTSVWISVYDSANVQVAEYRN